MSKLVFKAEDVRRIVEHSIGREQSPMLTGWDSKAGKAITQPVTAPSVILVHDQGVYLMSGAVERDMEGMPGHGCFCAYAQGCNPKTDEDWYETADHLVGGDDFGEHLPWAEQMKKALDAGARQIVINFSARQISLEAR